MNIGPILKRNWAKDIWNSMSQYPDHRGSTYVWNVGQYLPDYTVQHPRSQPYSYSQPREPEISQN
jgi:hypothetical protein